ncbi:hypothetical protein MMC11_005976, partial [Xylographa trunciseda]|nr:hypothetical protein [Xylographa trunciseda]
MSAAVPRQRLRDRFLFKLQKKENRSESSVLLSSQTPNDLSIPPLVGGISSNPRTAIASSSNAVPAVSQSTEAVDLQQPSNQDPVTACSDKLSQSATLKPVVVEPSLWALAYDDLQRSNPELITKFNHCLGINSTDVDKDNITCSSIDHVVRKAVEKLKEARKSKDQLDKTSATIRKHFEEAVKIIIASNNYISPAVSTNPYAAIAWTGISLLLPLLLSPTQENEAAIKGLDEITVLIVVYEWKEKLYVHNGDVVSDFRNQAIRLYTMILEYAATLLVHMSQNAPKRWVRDVFQAGDWSSRIASIQRLDASCRDVTNAIADVRTKAWRDEERRWQEKLLQQPRQHEEKRHIRMLYSNYEAGKNVNPERISGTCEWFLSHSSFLSWRLSQSSSLLWLSAGPGCGKSVLAKYLVDRKGEVLTVNTETPTMCYFFFKDGDVDRGDGTKAVCAFLHQIFMQQPHLYRHAQEDFENKSEKFLTDLDALWNIFLKATTNASGQEIICVLDALDECQEHSRTALTAKLVQLYSRRSSTNAAKPILKFLVTSRPEFSIVRDFKDLTRLRGEEESEHIKNEIDLVIKYKVGELGLKMDLSELDQSNLQGNLLSIPHRTYLWLYLVFDAIKEKLELSRHDIATIARTIPINVEKAYTAILDKSTDKEKARKLLHIVLAAKRPLSLQEANVAMVIEEGQESYKDLELWRPD